MAERGRRGSLAGLTILLGAALLAGATLLGALALAGCGGETEEGALAGHWTGGTKKAPMLVHIVKDGETYSVLANPNAPIGEATKQGDSLIVDTHAVEMRFTPASADELSLELGGEAFAEAKTVTLQRVDETQYADAAVAYGIAAIRRGIMMWVRGGGKEYPPPKEVGPDGLLGQMVSPWPPNLFSGLPMQDSENEGDYTYTVTDGGKGFTLVGHLSGGGTATGQ